MFGFYDSSINTLQVCTSVHDDQLFSSKESTIRHEAWHLVQACSAVKSKDDEWGNFVLVDSKRRVRGFYDGTKKEDIERLIEDINFLCNQ